VRACVMALAISLAAIVTGSISGCQTIDQDTKKTVQGIKDQSAIDKANADAKAKAAAEAAKHKPIRHPAEAAEIVVNDVRKPLGPIIALAILALGVGVGLQFTSLSALSKVIVPVAGGVGVVAFALDITLPFLPWILIPIVLGAIGLAIYEVIHKGSFSAAFSSLESDLKSVTGDVVNETKSVTAVVENVPPTSAAPKPA
jgi:hypothetical protein